MCLSGLCVWLVRCVFETSGKVVDAVGKMERKHLPPALLYTSRDRTTQRLPGTSPADPPDGLVDRPSTTMMHYPLWMSRVW